ncbi:MAG TPA: hypothetical protein VE776_00265 [Actinomycetota bacterium]|nr:hypothetical protein [Actinomycetota bacterium]
MPRPPRRLVTLTLTTRDRQGNTPPRAFKPVVLAARAGLPAPLAPLVGTKDRVRQYRHWIASIHNRDLVAVEPALRRLEVRR